MDDYDFNYKIQIAFPTLDYETPAYLILPYGTTIVVNSYSSTPPSMSRFDLPDQCILFAKNAKKGHGKAKKKTPFNRHNTSFMKKF